MWHKLLLTFTMVAVLHAADETEPYLTSTSIPAITHENFIPKLAFEPSDQPADIARRTQLLTAWFQQPNFQLNPHVIPIIISILHYANTNNIEHSHIITFIDYALPANQKRLWVFDLNTQQLLFHTYVSHGLKSGALDTRYFSNQFDSKASSIGVYRTEKPYYGRHGISLKLDGLDAGFNNNAESRAIVMHGGWYVEEGFIKKYGRAGRSWGCPAVPDEIIKPIINQIKDKSLFIVYYPNQNWLLKSKFLKGDNTSALTKPALDQSFIQPIHIPELREDILLAQLEKKNKYHETEAILVMPSAHYESLFQTKSPLNRMLRRQIEGQEYIALSTTEFNQLLASNSTLPPMLVNQFQDIYFVVPEIVMSHGYYATEMRKMPLGKISNVHHHADASHTDHYTVELDDHQLLSVKASHRFIRWLGL